ncbi:MAG: hypothetical protein D6722_16625, partial [Bacteroidetes bacterium]
FEDIVRSVASGNGDFVGRLENALGRRMIPFDDIRFNYSSMRFEANSTRGDIVPLVLAVNTN